MRKTVNDIIIRGRNLISNYIKKIMKSNEVYEVIVTTSIGDTITITFNSINDALKVINNIEKSNNATAHLRTI